jgi:hypothetical protein
MVLSLLVLECKVCYWRCHDSRSSKVGSIKRYEYARFFLLMFPPKQLSTMVNLTNAALSKLELNTTSSSEMRKFFGILILTASLFEFTSNVVCGLLWH